MSPEVRLLLVERELVRYLEDESEAVVRERVHVDRLSRILVLDTPTPTR